MEPVSQTLKKLVARIKKTVWVLGLHAFLFILLLVLVDLILSGFVFYNYVFLAEQEVPKVSGNIIKFDTKAYQDVLLEMQARKQVYQGSLTQ